jgi:hypothetical protein
VTGEYRGIQGREFTLPYLHTLPSPQGRSDAFVAASSLPFFPQVFRPSPFVHALPLPSRCSASL